jgi:hypothetical protein
MERNKRRLVTGLAAAGVLAGALAGGGAALAATSGSSQPAVTAAAFGPPAASAAAARPATPAAGKHPARYLRRVHAGRLVLRTSAAYLGLTPAQLREQLEAGKSLAAVAAARGKSVGGLEDAIVAAAGKRIDASKLTAARKAALTADVRAHVGTFVNTVHPFRAAARKLAEGAVPAPAPSTPASSAAAA